jgi:hypothetical protein
MTGFEVLVMIAIEASCVPENIVYINQLIAAAGGTRRVPV